MTRKSTLLKVVAIIMLILAIIATITVVQSMMLIEALGGAEALAFAGINPTIYNLSVIVSIIACVLEILGGILGLVSKSKGLLVKIGIILIVVALVSLIITIIAGAFAWTSLISFVLPILYLIGARSCVQ